MGFLYVCACGALYIFQINQLVSTDVCAVHVERSTAVNPRLIDWHKIIEII